MPVLALRDISRQPQAESPVTCAMPLPCQFFPVGNGFRRLLVFVVALAILLLAQQARALKLDVRVTGLEGDWETNVLAFLAIYIEREEDDLTAERVEALHRRAPDQIREALAPFGLYRVKVSDELTTPSKEGGTWVASYKVVPGEPVKVGLVDYKVLGPGADNAAFPKEFPVKAGQVLLHADYEKAKEEIRSIAAQQGYLDYELVYHRVLIDMEDYEAIIEFHLDTGPRYYLGDVRFKQDLLEDEYLQRFVTFKPGAVYDPELLLGLQGKLLGMEYYEKVEMVPLKDEAEEDKVIPIEVIAVRNKANKYRLGLGYATDVGPRVTLDWRRRYITKRGHKLKAELVFSQAIQNLELEYRIPIRNPMRDYMLIKPFYRAYDTASRTGDAFSLQFAHSVVTPRGWRRTAGIDYRYENYEFEDSGKQDVNELVPNVSWSKTVTDDPIYTTDGYRIKYLLLGTVEGLVSPASSLSGAIKFKWIKRFADKYRFITRTDLGATWANSLEDIPASRRFYAGGDNSIRGWGFEVLGPKVLETNDSIGGRFLAVGSLELERQIKGDWSAAVFTDFGNAFDPDYKKEIEVGAGFGLRWRSPVGQVRADVAFALTKEDPGARLHLVIGPDL